MKLPQLFRRDRGVIKAADAQDQVEKLLAESLRLLSQTASKVADLIEAQRLQRAGYESQNVLLRRLDTPRPATGSGGARGPGAPGAHEGEGAGKKAR